MILFQTAAAVCSGVIVGFTLGLVGGGGSILAVPLLLYVVGMPDPHLAIGTSALAVAFNAFANLVTHARERHVRWHPALIFAAAALAVAVRRLVDRQGGGRPPAADPVRAADAVRRGDDAARAQGRFGAAGAQRPVNLGRLGAIGLGTGALSGFYGIGGGFLVVPGLILATGMPTIAAIGSSLVAVGVFGMTTAVNYAVSGLVQWPVALLFIAGGIGGGWIGAHLAKRLSAQRQTF